MPANGLRYDPTTAQGLISQFDQSSGDFRQLDGEVQQASEHLATLWAGQASKQFQNVLSRWMTAFGQVRSGMQEMQSAMTTYKNNQARSEDDRTQIASNGSGGALQAEGQTVFAQPTTQLQPASITSASWT